MRLTAFAVSLSVLISCGLTAAPHDGLRHDTDPVPLKGWPVEVSPLVARASAPDAFEENAATSTASHFLSVVPCRLIDTRLAFGPFGGPALAAAQTRTVNVPSGPCTGIPANASAYSVNVTITNPAAAGWITVWPTGQAQPVVSTLNHLAGETIANAAIVPAGTGGSIDVATVAATHLIIDINGYFVNGVVTNLTPGAGLTGGGSGAIGLAIAPLGVSTAMLADGAVTDGKLSTISQAGKIANSATTATSANVADMIVARDSSGAFSAGAITLAGRIDQTSDDGVVARGTIASGSIPASGPGVRMMWYPAKAALRAGSITTEPLWDELFGTKVNPSDQWDETNVGLHSIAFGENVKASGAHSMAAGKETWASGAASLAFGETTTATGATAIALGYRAHTNARQGSFVFGDRSATDIIRAGVNNSANWRVAGGFRIFTSGNMTTGVTIQSGSTISNWNQTNAVISTSTGAYLSTTGNWLNASNRDLKTDFERVDTREVLRKVVELPLQTWRYKIEPEEVRHMGPMAQDFASAFSLGRDEKAIGTVDIDGVALAAIQGLHEELQDRDRMIDALQSELARQRESIELLKALACEQSPGSVACR